MRSLLIGYLSFGNVPYKPTGFVVAKGEVRSVQPSPVRSVWASGRLVCMPHELADTSTIGRSYDRPPLAICDAPSTVIVTVRPVALQTALTGHISEVDISRSTTLG